MEGTVATKIAVPPPPKWEMRLAPGTEGNVVFFLINGPNAFHRFMQRVMLGIIWTRIAS